MMVKGRVSVLIPSRNERFLQPTVADVLSKARGDLEVVVILDGYWPDPPLQNDPRLKVLHFGEARGMRPAINASVQVATGEYLLKADAHTAWSEGYDEVLKGDYHEDNWILIPRRYPLDPEKWSVEERTDSKYPIDYHSLSEPFHKYGDSVPGLHGTNWTARREERKHIELDQELASQGSAYFLSRKCWDWIGPLDQSLYGSFWLENLEMSMKVWMMGGAQMVTKRAHFLHLFKGARHGRGYSTRGMGHEDAIKYANWFWCTDQPFKGRVRTMKQVLEMFAPVPTWDDIDAILDRARREFRNPYAVAV